MNAILPKGLPPTKMYPSDDKADDKQVRKHIEVVSGMVRRGNNRDSDPAVQKAGEAAKRRQLEEEDRQWTRGQRM